MGVARVAIFSYIPSILATAQNSQAAARISVLRYAAKKNGP